MSKREWGDQTCTGRGVRALPKAAAQKASMRPLREGVVEILDATALPVKPFIRILATGV